ncbi:LysE family translocator [Photobacterium sp. TY1-4]|uniref:LysE family translocator n=1 Tax=Photobacterium sp. TY1-4 TaxID=2899122 RepID=UPI0021BE2A60|nr:LysE family translocator [Photobacterium sp. TY1-4]UXI03040.1 LysE family translocator [Photobacterium sp. TY1-4]
MLGIENLWLFVVSGLLLNLIPGPDSLLIIGRGATQGFKAGSAAALGIGTGTLIHILAAAFGLSAILATSAMAFTVVKLIGGAYLIYMAITMLLQRHEASEAPVAKPVKTSLSRIYTQGFITNLFNPKIAIFFLAFVPQFISASSDNKALAFIVLGLIFNFNGMLWCHFLAWLSSTVSNRLSVNENVQKWLSRMTASLFGLFGVKLLISGQS